MKEHQLFDASLVSWSPPKEVSFLNYAEEYINLPKLTCPEEGPFRAERTPYVLGPMLAFQNIHIEELILLWGRQLAKSTFIYNCLCFIVGVKPGPTLMLFPDEKLTKYTSKNRIQEQFKICSPVMEQKTNNVDDWGLYELKFLNMVLDLGWAGSGSQVMSKPVQNLFFDEVDEMKSMVGKGVSNPIDSAEQTTSNFPHRKIVKTSTPSEEDNHIWQALIKCKFIFEYWMPCPYCGIKQILIWNQIKFPKEERDPEKVCLVARYECVHCGEQFTNSEKIKMLIKGEWRARVRKFKEGKNPASDEILEDRICSIEETITLVDLLEKKITKKIGFHLPKWYSPFENATFGHAAKEFLESQNDFTKQRDWTKFWAAKPYIERAKTVEYVEILKNKVNIPPLICPEDTRAIITTVDPGQGGFWFLVAAWKIVQNVNTCHIIHYGFLPGWDNVSKLCFEDVYKIDGTEDFRHSWRFGIDTGGSKYDEDLTMTEAAYIWLRKHSRRNIFGVKGKSLSKSSKRVTLSIIDKMPGQKSEIIPGGLAIWIIDTDQFKDAIQFYLEQEPGQPGAITFHNETQDDLVSHILSEKKERNKKGVLEWRKKGKHNHWLDCLVYNYALADQECMGGIKVLKQPIRNTVKKETRREPRKTNWLAGINKL